MARRGPLVRAVAATLAINQDHPDRARDSHLGHQLKGANKVECGKRYCAGRRVVKNRGVVALRRRIFPTGSATATVDKRVVK